MVSSSEYRRGQSPVHDPFRVDSRRLYAQCLTCHFRTNCQSATLKPDEVKVIYILDARQQLIVSYVVELMVVYKPTAG